MDAERSRTEELLAQAAWARRVARALVRDADLAEDVAQEALESGLRQPGRIRADTRGWLWGVIRNLSRQALRSRARRARREERARTPAPPAGPMELAEKVEAQRVVAEAVLALPEPSRSALILRFYEQLPVREVARRLDVSPQAAESRIRRGLQRLRDDLQGRFGEDWSALIAPLAAAPSLTSAGPIASTIIMTTKTKIAVGVAVVALLALATRTMLQENDGGEDLALVAAERHGASEASSMSGVDVRADGDGIEDIGAATPITRDARRRGFRLRVVDHLGTSISRARVTFWTTTSAEASSNIASGESPELSLNFRDPDVAVVADEGGRVFLPCDDPSGSGIAYAEAPGFVKRALPVLPENHAESTRDLGDLILGPGGHVAALLLDENGRPLPGIRVEFHASKGDGALSGDQYSQLQTSGPDGIARFPSLPRAKGTLSSSHPGFLPWSREGVEPTERPAPPIPIVVDRGSTARLTVVDGVGSAVEGAAVYMRPPMLILPRAWIHRQNHCFLGDTDESGSILVSGVSESGFTPLVIKKGDTWLGCPIGAGDAKTVTLPDSKALTGRFVTSEGVPLSESQVHVMSTSRSRLRVLVNGSLDRDGRLALALPEDSYALLVVHEAGSWLPESPIALTDDVDLGTQIVAEGPAFRLTCFDAQNAEPVEDPEMLFRRVLPVEGGTRPPMWKSIMLAGVASPSLYSIEGHVIEGRQLPPGAYQVLVRAPGYAGQELDLHLSRNGDQDIRVELSPSCHLVLEVLDAVGNPVPGKVIELVPAGRQVPHTTSTGPSSTGASPINSSTDAAGIARFDRLRPGTWNAGFLFEARFGVALDTLEIQPGDNQHVLRLPPETHVTVETSAHGSPVPNARIEITPVREDPHRRGLGLGMTRTTDRSGILEFPWPHTGEHRMRVTAPGFLPEERVLRLEGGRKLVELDFAGVSVSGVVHGGSEDTEVVLYESLDPDVSVPDQRRRVRLAFREESADSRVAISNRCRFGFVRVGTRGSFRFSAVPPGRYWVVARSSDRVTSEPQQLEVGDSNVTDVRLELRPAARIVVDVSGVTEYLSAQPESTLRVTFVPESADGMDYGSDEPFVHRNGECVITQAPAGPGRLRISTLSDEGYELLDEVPLNPVAGQEMRVSWDARSVLADEQRKGD